MIGPHFSNPQLGPLGGEIKSLAFTVRCLLSSPVHHSIKFISRLHYNLVIVSYFLEEAETV